MAENSAAAESSFSQAYFSGREGKGEGEGERDSTLHFTWRRRKRDGADALPPAVLFFFFTTSRLLKSNNGIFGHGRETILSAWRASWLSRIHDCRIYDSIEIGTGVRSACVEDPYQDPRWNRECSCPAVVSLTAEIPVEPVKSVKAKRNGHFRPRWSARY